MRRTRNRFFTIDAQNEEEFIKEYENMKKSRLSEMNFQKNSAYNADEVIGSEEDLLSSKKPGFKLTNSDSDDGYEGLGAGGGLGVGGGIDEDEDNLDQIYEDDEILRGEEGMIPNQKQNIEEKGLEMLCLYLKNSVKEMSKDKSGESIFFNNKNKNVMNALSGNAIYDLNIRDLVDNILTENDNEYNKINEGNNNSLKDFIFQNIESDSTLKIMIMSNNKSTKNSFIESFFSIKKLKSEEDNYDSPFEIRKKQIKLFNKNISLQIFDTSDEFHKNSLSSVYYKTVSAFFIFIEASKNNSKNYLDFIFEKIKKFITNKTCVIFGINMLFKEDCTIEGNNLRDYANEKNVMFIPFKINEFNMKNNLIINLFKLILIKGIDNKILSRDSLRKGSKDKNLGTIQNKLKDKIKKKKKKKDIYDISKMNIESSLGYKKKYRIKHINAFDIEDDYSSIKNKRKLSADI